MVIYRARVGDTVASISREHGVLPTLLCEQNGILPEAALVPGQALVIFPPTETMQVREGDSLHSLAARKHISPAQLLRQNPSLGDEGRLYPGTRLITSLEERGHSPLSVLGIVNAGCDTTALAPVLPYLTYLGVASARLLPSGRLCLPHDEGTVAAARAGGAVPLLILSAEGEGGIEGERARTRELLTRPDGGGDLAEELLPHLTTRGYGGLLLDLPLPDAAMMPAYTALLARLRRRLTHRTAVLACLPPADSYAQYGALGRAAAGVLLTTYGIGTRYGSPMPEAPYDRLVESIDAAAASVRPSKLFAGLSTRMLDFPAVGGGGRLLTPTEFDERASNGRLAYDPVARVPYLSYRENGGDRIAFYEDAESFSEKLLLCERRGLGGICLFPAEGVPQQLLSVLGGLFPIVRAHGT